MDPESRTDIYRDILLHMNARYLSVRPEGVEVTPARPLLRELTVRLLNHGGARTLYRSSKGNRRPVCRSLNGVRPLKNSGQECTTCAARAACTPQVRVDLLFEGLPYRLLLAFTSAQNFLRYVARVAAEGLDVRDVETRISVIPRGSWGALVFEHRRR